MRRKEIDRDDVAGRRLDMKAGAAEQLNTVKEDEQNVQAKTEGKSRVGRERERDGKKKKKKTKDDDDRWRTRSGRNGEGERRAAKGHYRW